MEYDPKKNENAISLIKQDDGNWKGFAIVRGTFIEVREIGPSIALQRILTHE